MLILIFLGPLFFLPITSEFFEFQKQTLVLAIFLFTFLAWLLKMAWEKEIKIWRTPLDFPLGIFAGVLVLSTIFSEGQYESGVILVPFLALLGLAFLFVQIFSREKELNLLFWLLLVSGVITSLLSLTLFFLPLTRFPLQFSLFNFPFALSGPSWSPTGALLSQTLFLLALIPIGLGFFRKFFKSEKISLAFFLVVISFLLFLGLGFSLSQLFTAARPQILPPSVGWKVSTGVMGESFKNTLLGSGPGTFFSDFTRFRPPSFNLHPLGNLRFSFSANFYFQLLAEVGVLGLFAYLFLIFLTLKSFFRQKKIFRQTLTLLPFSAFLIFVLAQLFLPFSFFLLFLEFIFLGIFLTAQKVSQNQNIFALTFTLVAFREGLVRLEKAEELPRPEIQARPLAPQIFFFPALILLSFIFYFGARVYLADFWFQKSLVAIAQNRGNDAYNFQIRAYKLNPWKAEYRIAFSQTNLALANTLAQKADLPDQEKALITPLIQQAIREARNAVFLAPQKVTAFENLAQIYRQLLNFAQGADLWAIASYNQAIALDPTSPSLRLDLGGVFYAQRRYDQARELFTQAVNLKPDFANAHYNLGHAFEEKGDLARAIQEYKITQQLVAVDSQDYRRLSQEIASSEKKLPPPPLATASEELQISTPTSQLKPPQRGLKLSPESGELSTPSPRPAKRGSE